MRSAKDGILVSNGSSVDHLSWNDIQNVSDLQYKKARREMILSPMRAIQRNVNWLDFNFKIPKDEAFMLTLESAARFNDIKR